MDKALRRKHRLKKKAIRKRDRKLLSYKWFIKTLMEERVEVVGREDIEIVRDVWKDAPSGAEKV